VQRAEAELQHPGHAAEQADLLGAERGVAAAAEHQHAGGGAAEGREGDRVPPAGQVESGAAAGGDLGEDGTRHVGRGQADAGDHAVVDNEHGDVGVQSARGAADGGVVRCRAGRPVGDHGEELRQLLGRLHSPPVGRAAGQLRESPSAHPRA
jgi:hypothetical protein